MKGFKLLLLSAMMAGTATAASAQSANITYTGSDTQAGINVSYSVTTNGNTGILALSDIVSSSITFSGTAASAHGAFSPFTSNNNIYFINSNSGGAGPVSASLTNLFFNFAGPGGALNFDTEEFRSVQNGSLDSNAPDDLSGLVYALAARGVNDGDATVYNHGDLATAEVDDTRMSSGLEPGTFTVRAPTNQAFATAVTGAVPEPASWAMMVLGVGAAGYAMRRRQKVAVKVAYAA